MRYEAFPYQRYGLASGTVEEISKTVINPQEVRLAIGIDEPVYRVKVKLAKQSMLANGKVVADLENFDFDLKFKVVGFVLSATIKGYTQEERSNSGRLTSKQKALLKRISPGQKIYFEDVRAKGPDGKTRKLGTLSFKLK